jgi:hypothetical protein
MKNKNHSFERIQILKNLCGLINEEPIEAAFHFINESDLTDDSWDAMLYFLSYLFPHLQELTVNPFNQIRLLKVVESVLTKKDDIYDGMSIEDIGLCHDCRDGVLFVDDVEIYLLETFNICVLES